jgi:large subunit ribosomal protein L6
MSRIGKKPIPVPSGVKIDMTGGAFVAEGPKGKVSHLMLEGISVELDDGQLQVKRANDERQVRARHGLMRALLANAVQGVAEGFTKSLDVVGVGYRGEVKGQELHLALGYSHPVVYAIPESVEVEVERNTRIIVRGADRQQVGQVAAELRRLRPPDAYKGKGIRYTGEQLRLKVGKAGGK